MDSELRQFSVQALKEMGALVEEREDAFDAALPEGLSSLLGCRDYLTVGEGCDAPFSYGSLFLEQLMKAVCNERVSLARGWSPGFLKAGGWEELVQDTFTWQNARGKVVASQEVRTAYRILYFFYEAKSDEVSRGFFPAVFHETSLSSPHGFYERWVSLETESEPLPSFSSVEDPDPFLRQVERHVVREVSDRLQDFRASRERRWELDRKRLREYYESQEREMKKLLLRQGLDEEKRKIREEKIARLPLDLQAKEADLLHKYGMRVEIDCRASLQITTKAIRIDFELHRRKEKRALSLFWNPVTKRIDPLLCEACGENITSVTVCDVPHLLCHSCARSCPVCQGEKVCKIV